MATYVRLVDFKDPNRKEEEFFKKSNHYFFNKKQFDDIPGKAISYHISDRLFEIFRDFPQVKDISDPKVGLQTGKNDLYYREWHEVDFHKIAFNSENKKWIPCIKGGDARKWYGNFGTIINWENDGYAVKHQSGSVIRNSGYYFKEGLAWTKITSNFALRYFPSGMIMTDASVFVFPKDIKPMLGCLNSRIMPEIIGALNPTLNFVASTVAMLPMVYPKDSSEIENLVDENIDIVKNDWNESEYSWDYKKNVFLTYCSGHTLLRDIYEDICKYRNDSETKLNINETKLDDIFSSLYQIELEKTELIKNKSLSHNSVIDDVKSLISYAVGCILGRYSLKEDGLIYAGGEWDKTRYSEEFQPCDYGVMLITEDQYFEEDLCTRVIDFIEVVYGKDTLNENLNFIAQALKSGSKDPARKVIRNYLYEEKGFFDNHYQIYQHRPIYWMMSSGKAGGFRALIYMHRYNQNTLSVVRSEFLHELRYKYEADRDLQQKRANEASTTAERNEAKKKITNLDKKMVEVNQYDDLVNHTTGNISEYIFDLDDGVKVNYAKFLNIDGVKTQNLLVPIKL